MAVSLGGVAVLSAALPQQYRVPYGTVLQLPYGVSVSSPALSASADGAAYRAELRWLGLFPIKNASVRVVDTVTVIPCGTPFGIKLYTEGVLVVGLSDVDTPGGRHNPARAAGLKTGDVILSVFGTSLSSMQQLSAAVESSEGRTVTLRVRRDGIEFDVRFAPAFSVSEKCYKAGIWVRDSSAGIGTMTFYDLQTMRFAGLGHAVCDTDTGQILPISSGEAVPARIYEVIPGRSGVPGELRGGFEAGVIGPLTVNGPTGLYGLLEKKPAYAAPVPVAMRQQVHTGAAVMLTTVEGTTPKSYDIEIEKLRYADGEGRHMVIRVTDPDLLAAAGGIVQGMSGSPIIQDGRLIGAVTHVFVNDPQRGYAIFAETMLDTLQEMPDLKAAA
ncbi:MAG: SpoIVB peptidase [Clostridia bacterium]|nr:SpoIVB peptidase [Clostridia bacterium]